MNERKIKHNSVDLLNFMILFDNINISLFRKIVWELKKYLSLKDGLFLKSKAL